MGFVRKITGAQAQIDQAGRNAKAQEDQLKESARQAEQNAMQAAKAAADSQASLAARQAAEQKASAAVSTPLSQVDVSVESDAGSTADVRRRRAKFGKDYNSGVNI